MQEKEIYKKLLLYSSCLLMIIGGIRIVCAVLNRIMSSLPISVLIFAVGALYFITYKNFYHKN